MNNKPLLLCSILLLVSAVTAQDNQTSAETIQDRLGKASRAQMGIAYRHHRIVEGSVDGAPPKVAIEDVYTRDPQTGIRSVKRQHTPDGIITSEVVQLFSGQTFKKTGDGPWEVDPAASNAQRVVGDKPVRVIPKVSPAPKPSPETNVSLARESVSRFPDKPRENSAADDTGTYPDKTAPTGSPRRIKDGTCEPERLNGRATLRCEMSRISGNERDWVETHWFDEKGLLAKSVIKMSYKTTAGSTVLGITTISYEYDPTIKVEAPVK